MKWLSGIDVNAVFAAVLAAIAYWHNHQFRVRKETGTLTPPTSPPSAAGAVAVALLVAVVLGFASCGATPQKRDTYAAAIATCSIGTLAALDVKLADVEAQHSTEASVVFSLELATQEAICVRATVRAAEALQGSGAQ